jgi:hypothetical protein
MHEMAFLATSSQLVIVDRVFTCVAFLGWFMACNVRVSHDFDDVKIGSLVSNMLVFVFFFGLGYPLPIIGLPCGWHACCLGLVWHCFGHDGFQKLAALGSWGAVLWKFVGKQCVVVGVA